MADNQTIPYPLFNQDTVATYPVLIIAFVIVAAEFVFGIAGLISLIHQTYNSGRSPTHYRVFAMIILCLIRQVFEVSRMATTYYQLTITISNAAFNVASLILVFCGF